VEPPKEKGLPSGQCRYSEKLWMSIAKRGGMYCKLVFKAKFYVRFVSVRDLHPMVKEVL
jgi:hypothetical protein